MKEVIKLATVLDEVKRAVRSLPGKRKVHVTVETRIRERFSDRELNELLFHIESKFNIEIPYRDREALATIGDVVRYIKGHMKVPVKSNF